MKPQTPNYNPLQTNNYNWRPLPPEAYGRTQREYPPSNGKLSKPWWHGFLKVFGICTGIFVLVLIGLVFITGAASSVSTEPTTTTSTTQAPKKTASIPTQGENALKSTRNYSNIFHWSNSQLREQLQHDGFPQDAIDYGLLNADIDYDANALASARNYSQVFAWSDSQIYDQLIHDGFTDGQAQYGIDNLHN